MPPLKRFTYKHKTKRIEVTFVCYTEEEAELMLFMNINSATSFELI